MEDRRRATRIPTEIPAKLYLAGGKHADVTISNVGELGVLLSLSDLEVTVHEGDRAMLEHPTIVDGVPQGGKHKKTPAAIVRVDLDLESGAVVRHVALFFDGGPKPAA